MGKELQKLEGGCQERTKGSRGGIRKSKKSIGKGTKKKSKE